MLSLLKNSQCQGCNEQRTFFGVLKIAIPETLIWVKMKQCSEEEKDLGHYTNKTCMVLKSHVAGVEIDCDAGKEIFVPKEQAVTLLQVSVQ